MIDKKDNVFLGTNIKGMMMTLVAHWNEKMDVGCSNTEFADIRPSDMRVFGQLRGRSVKLSEIHKEMGFSRQAAQQAIDRLVAHGVIRVDFDEDSKRDKVVSITDKGQELRTLAAIQIRDIETECADLIGENGKEELRDLLTQLLSKTRK